MKLESLKLDKFKGSALKREQMFMLNGGGIATGGGNITAPAGAYGKLANFDYGYDSQRSDGNGGTFLTFHNRTCVYYVKYEETPILPTLPTLTAADDAFQLP